MHALNAKIHSSFPLPPERVLNSKNLDKQLVWWYNFIHDKEVSLPCLHEVKIKIIW